MQIYITNNSFNLTNTTSKSLQQLTNAHKNLLIFPIVASTPIYKDYSSQNKSSIQIENLRTSLTQLSLSRTFLTQT